MTAPWNDSPYRIFICYATRGRILPGQSSDEKFYTNFYNLLRGQLELVFGYDRTPPIYFGPACIDQSRDWQGQVTWALQTTIAFIRFVGAPRTADQNINCEFELRQLLQAERDDVARQQKPVTFVQALRLRTVLLSPPRAAQWSARQIYNMTNDYFDDQGNLTSDWYRRDAVALSSYEYNMLSR